MSNSSLVNYVNITQNHKTPRDHKIDTITIHCFVGQVTAKQGCDVFATTDRDASCNYVVGKDGDIGLCVEEEYRSWCSSNKENDMRAICIECASDKTEPYSITDKCMSSLIKLCADICKRNGIPKLLWKEDKSLIGKVNEQNMTVHRWFANKSCPGTYIYEHLGMIANEVNKLLVQEVQEMPEQKQEIDTSKLMKIMSNSAIPAEYWAKLFIAKGLGEYLPVVDNFFEAEKYYGVNASVLICQSLLETGYFKFTGYVKKEWNNFGGLGATDNNANKNVAIFPNIFLGCVAQAQHMVAYADTFDPVLKYDGWVIVDPRFSLVKRGVAPYVEWLGQKENPEGKGWASGKDYGYKILKIYNEVLTEYNKSVKAADEAIQKPSVEVNSIEEEFKKRVDTPDYEVQITPSKILVYDAPNGKVIDTLKRSRQIIIEEQNGWGLLDANKGWIMLGYCSYVKDIEEEVKEEISNVTLQD